MKNVILDFDGTLVEPSNSLFSLLTLLTENTRYKFNEHLYVVSERVVSGFENQIKALKLWKQGEEAMPDENVMIIKMKRVD